MDGTKYDLRKPTLLTNQPFDDAWTDVEHDADGKTTATFTRPDGLTVTVGGDETITSFQVCTGTGFPAEKHPGWHRRGTADRLRKRLQHRQRAHHHQARRDQHHQDLPGSGTGLIHHATPNRAARNGAGRSI